MNLESMKVVVTGGASGMGRDFCLSLVRSGASVAACDMNEDGLASLVEEASDAPGTLKTYVANVADEALFRKLARLHDCPQAPSRDRARRNDHPPNRDGYERTIHA